MKTAVEWLEEQFNLNLTAPLSPKYQDLVNTAKAMEKEQIIEAYETAMETDIYNRPLKIGKEYYNETFKTK